MRLGQRVELGVCLHALVNVVFAAVAIAMGAHAVASAGAASPPAGPPDAAVIGLSDLGGVVVTSSSQAAVIDLAPPASRTAAQPPAPAKAATRKAPPAVSQPAAADLSDARFDRLAMCESNGDPTAVNGAYRGAFQFLPSTWHDAGGTGDPIEAPYEVQRSVAQALAATSDPAREWPVCWTRTA